MRCVTVRHLIHANLLILDAGPYPIWPASFEHLACQDYAEDHKNADNPKVPVSFIYVRGQFG